MRPPIIVRSIIVMIAACAAIFAQVKTDDVIKVDTAVVNIPVIVSDRDNRFIPGLNVGNFRVFQDGTEQKIEAFDSETAPMNIVLALDTSRSTYGVLGKIKKAAREFIKDLDADDRAMIVTFDYQVNVLSPLTSDKRALDKAIKEAKVGEIVGTLLNDAVYGAIRNTLRNIKGRKAIVLLTDGKDFGSGYSRNTLIDQLNESDTVIYPIYYETGNQRIRFPRNPNNNRGMGRFPGGMGRGGLGRGGMGRFPGGNFPGRGRDRPPVVIDRPNVERQNQAAIQFLEHLAEMTGGRMFDAKKGDLKSAFQQIADEMKRQYLLAFYPAGESPTGTYHKIRVQVDRPGSVVRTKGGYTTAAK